MIAPRSSRIALGTVRLRRWAGRQGFYYIRAHLPSTSLYRLLSCLLACRPGVVSSVLSVCNSWFLLLQVRSLDQQHQLWEMYNPRPPESEPALHQDPKGIHGLIKDGEALPRFRACLPRKSPGFTPKTCWFRLGGGRSPCPTRPPTKLWLRWPADYHCADIPR